MQKKSTNWLPLEAAENIPQEAPPHDSTAAVQQRVADGYRTILQLYLFEGYDHGEIAEQLELEVAFGNCLLYHVNYLSGANETCFQRKQKVPYMSAATEK